MKAFPTFLVLALCAVPAAGAAQQAANPVSSALRQLAQRGQRNLVAAAEEMPADKYGFKPTPAQMSFGEVVGHVAGSNEFLCAAIAGTKAPASEEAQPALADNKEKLVARVRQSFVYCDSTLAKVDDSKLADSVPFFGGRQVSRALAMLVVAQDWADHYSQAAMYLRLNGLLPPTARPRN